MRKFQLPIKLFSLFCNEVKNSTLIRKFVTQTFRQRLRRYFRRSVCLYVTVNFATYLFCIFYFTVLRASAGFILLAFFTEPETANNVSKITSTNSRIIIPGLRIKVMCPLFKNKDIVSLEM